MTLITHVKYHLGTLYTTQPQEARFPTQHEVVVALRKRCSERGYSSGYDDGIIYMSRSGGSIGLPSSGGGCSGSSAVKAAMK